MFTKYTTMQAEKTAQNQYRLKLKGVIGADFSGIAVSDEIDYLNTIGAELIVLEINSAGGDIIDGYNIITSILQSNAKIETFCTGVAASMAAVILAAGAKRKAYDFSTGLVHDPLLNGTTLEALEDGQQKENLTRIKTALSGILQSTCKQPKKVINELMSRETMLSSKEMLQLGMIDEVVKTKFLKAQIGDYSLAKYSNICDKWDNNIKTKTQTNMNLITGYLKLSAEASEDSILKEIKKIEGTAESLQNELTAKASELEQATAKLTEAENKLQGFAAAAITNAVEAAISSGKFTEEQKDTLTEQATKDIELFNAMVAAIPKPHTGTLQVLENSAKPKPKEGEEDKNSFEWLQKNDPAKLKQLQATNEAEFNKLYEEYVAQE